MNANGEVRFVTNFPDDAKCIILWSLENGSQVASFHRDEDFLSFAYSLDGRMLTVSHTSGSICLIDTINKFRILAEINIPSVCGIIKFSPDHWFLFCWHESHERRHGVYRLSVKRINQDTFSLRVSCDVSYKPWEYETASKAGFLLGDPLCCIYENVFGHSFLVERAFIFVLSEKIILRCFPEGRSVVMFSVDEISSFTNSAHHPHLSRAVKMAFSLNGEILYVISEVLAEREVMAWNVRSENLTARMMIGRTRRECLTPVAEGVIIAKDCGCPELWDFELSRCIRSWSRVCNITNVIPLSRDHVACVGAYDKEVIILDSRSTGVKARIPFFVTNMNQPLKRWGKRPSHVTANTKYCPQTENPFSCRIVKVLSGKRNGTILCCVATVSQECSRQKRNLCYSRRNAMIVMIRRYLFSKPLPGKNLPLSVEVLRFLTVSSSVMRNVSLISKIPYRISVFVCSISGAVTYSV